MNAAVRHPERIRAAASIYGVALVSDKPDSPHLAPQRTDARLYFGCAENDLYAPPEMIDRLRAEIAAKGRQRGSRNLSRHRAWICLSIPSRVRQTGGGAPLGTSFHAVWCGNLRSLLER